MKQERFQQLYKLGFSGLAWVLFFLTLILLMYANKIPYLNLVKDHIVMICATLSLGLFSQYSYQIRKMIVIASILFGVIFFFQKNLGAVLLFTLAFWSAGKFKLESIKQYSSRLNTFFSIIWQKYFWITLFLVLLIGSFLFFHLSFASYFEGDEWIFFRYYEPLLRNKIWFIEGFLQTFRTVGAYNPHITPIADMFYVIEFKLFGLHFEPYLITSIVLHVLTSLVLARLVYELSHSKLIVFISTVFFAFNGIHAEAITWILAALYTQLAVLFGTLSLLLFVRSASLKASKVTVILCYLNLIFALWSKETAVIFPIIIFFSLLKQKKIMYKSLHWKLIVSAGVIFVLTELIGRRNQLFTHSLQAASSPWLYQIVNLYNTLPPGVFAYRCFSLFFKMLAQSIVPNSVIKSLSITVTNLQFPFFNQEKSVGGTTYVNFIQSPMPEMISYLLGTIILFLTFTSKRLRTKPLFCLGVMYWFLGIIPILLIIVGFPWLIYSPYIGSRHFYHLNAGLALVAAVTLVTFVQSTWVLKTKGLQVVFIGIILIMYIAIQYQVVVFETREKQLASDFKARENIIEKLQTELKTPPKQMIIYTTSDRGYYGFSLLMLPFPTAVSHMLPIIFSDQFNEQGGLHYPKDFFTEEYFKGTTEGLATQGYFKKDEYGLGYFLEKPKLIRTLENENLSAEYVSAFRFNSEENSFTNISKEFQKEIGDLLESRMIFRSWINQDFEKDFFKFKIDPSWSVQKSEAYYLVLDDKSRQVMKITIYREMKTENFHQFVKDQVINMIKIGEELGTDTLSSDLGITRVMLYPNWNKNIFFVAGGRGTTFYKMEISQEDKAKLIFRTMEFVD